MSDEDLHFLGLEPHEMPALEPHFRILPIGLERTVSYGRGTASGPRAILTASQEVELFDTDYLAEPCRDYGLETLAEPRIAPGMEPALDQVDGLVEAAVDAGRTPVVIGGEHSLTAGAVRPFVRRYADLTILQLDAHCDLRDGYMGERYSHASAMRRCLDFDNVSLVMGGIRNVSAEEHAFMQRCDRLRCFDAAALRQEANVHAVAEHLRGRRVYLTFDVDVLDPAIMPSTGTPEPGGLTWDEVTHLIRLAVHGADVVGIDFVEHAPIKGLHAPDFLSAKLIYRIMSDVYHAKVRNAPGC